MNWIDRLLGRSESESQELEEDKRALRNLKDSFKRVRVRTDRLVDDYERADRARRHE
jgi:hypothetical protein